MLLSQKEAVAIGVAAISEAMVDPEGVAVDPEVKTFVLPLVLQIFSIVSVTVKIAVIHLQPNLCKPCFYTDQNKKQYQT